MVEKIGELESKSEVSETIEKTKPRETKELENKIETQLEKMKEKIAKIKKRKEKLRNNLVRSKIRENVLWFVLLCGCVIVTTPNFFRRIS